MKNETGNFQYAVGKIGKLEEKRTQHDTWRFTKKVSTQLVDVADGTLEQFTEALRPSFAVPMSDHSTNILFFQKVQNNWIKGYIATEGLHYFCLFLRLSLLYIF